VRKLRRCEARAKSAEASAGDAISPGLALLYKSLVGLRNFRRAPGRGFAVGPGNITWRMTKVL
jgi:hypothetical protein